MKNTTTIILVVGILLLLNFLSQQFFLRFDLTAENQYTLSKATRNILKDLQEPVTIKAYFSEDLPAPIEKAKKDFLEMLYEYNTISKGMLVHEVINPKTQEQQGEAYQSGVAPQQVQVRKDNELKLQNIFSGAVIQMGDQKDAIPFIGPNSAIEYPLSTGIKKLSVIDKPAVGIIQGHGEPGLQELQTVAQTLGILYSVENIDLSSEGTIPIKFKTIALVGPKDSIPPNHLAKLDEFLGRGGNMFIGIDRVNGDLSTAQGSIRNTGLETWLRGKGVEVDPTFIVDADCGAVTVQSMQGPFRVNNQVKFHYFPKITKFADHPITNGLEAAMLPFASPIRPSGDSSIKFSPIATTSDRSGTQNPPITFDVMRQWSEADFPLGAQTVGALLEGSFVNNIPSKIVLFSDGEFPMAGGQGSDNVNLIVNSIDWLSDDTGLIELRTKGATSRPIEQLEVGKQNFLKYLNFLLPIVLVLLVGVYRSFRSKSKRTKRMQENYG